MLIYREKDNLFYKLHPFTKVFYVFSILLLSMMFSHPIYLLGLFFAIGLSIISSENLSEWKGYLKITTLIIIIIIVVNVIIVNTGSTVIYKGPKVPVLGRIKITMEAFVYAVGMGIRLLTIISIFCFYTYAVHPDKILKLFSKWGNKSVLVITLSTRLFPLMLADYKRISEVQRCRGVKLYSGGWMNRIKNMLPIISALLLSSLERSFQLAESMHARGYGSGHRTYYNKDIFKPRDYLIIFSILIALITSLWAFFNGLGRYNYYPKLQKIDLEEIRISAFITIALGFPAILNWGWKKCKILKLKI